MDGSDYNIRYAENWGEISRKARSLTKGLCCYPGCQQRASAVHHALYRDNRGAIAGREKPGIHVFGLCDYHHSKEAGCAHHPKNWKHDSKDPVLGNQNTSRFYLRLREGWKEKMG
jgi:hypothetical protein